MQYNLLQNFYSEMMLALTDSSGDLKCKTLCTKCAVVKYLVTTSFCTILEIIFPIFLKMCKKIFSNLHTDFGPRRGTVKQEKHPFETNNFLNNGLFSRKTNNHLLWMQIFQGANFLHLCKIIIFYTESKSRIFYVCSWLLLKQ